MNGLAQAACPGDFAIAIDIGHSRTQAGADGLHRRGLRPRWHHAEQIAGENHSLINAELGIYAADFWMLRHTQAPALLLEAGVIVNREEELQLEQAAYRERIIQALLEAIIGFCACQDQGDPQVDARYARK